MSFNLASSILAILALAGILLVPAAGCSRPVAVREPMANPSVKPALPLLDMETPGRLETAYFAMG